MGRKGPRGATVERQVEIRETYTWTFTADELRERLSLPDDTQLIDADSGGFIMGVRAVSVETRTQKHVPAGAPSEMTDTPNHPFDCDCPVCAPEGRDT